MIKNLLLLTFLVFTIPNCFADEPPSWSPYIKVSENKNYFCLVSFADKDFLKEPWERKWEIGVFNKDSILIWKKPIQPTGYEEGSITNDGNAFVIVDFWYSDEGNIVRIHYRNSDDFFIKGKEFNVPNLFLEKTVSHRLWRENYEIKDDKIIIETNDKNIWEVDLTNKKLTLIRNNFLIISSIIIFSLLFVVVLALFFCKKRKRRVRLRK